MEIFGLIGKRLGHSFSRNYFTEKFAAEGRDAAYWNFEMPDIKALPEVLREFPNLKGLNVTVPFKEEVLPYLDEISEEAGSIGAVNMIRITRDASGIPHTKGYNTDFVGFRDSLSAFKNISKAIILGSGGAAKAVRYALQSLGVEVLTVSRRPKAGESIPYSDLTPDTVSAAQLIVNATPLGMYPNTETAPDFPYHLLTPSHLCYDLTYNPTETLFMRLSAQQGAQVKNGLEMLHRQAEAAGF